MVPVSNHPVAKQACTVLLNRFVEFGAAFFEAVIYTR